jgi:hypothetical protein
VQRLRRDLAFPGQGPRGGRSSNQYAKVFFIACSDLVEGQSDCPGGDIRKELASTGLFEYGFFTGMSTLSKIEINQVLIGDAGLVGHLFKVFNDVSAKSQGHLLF